MNDTTINYVIYIATTPENLWDALTNPEALKTNWGIIQSQWTVGAPVTEVSESRPSALEGRGAAKRTAAASVVYFPSNRHWRTHRGALRAVGA